MTTYFCDYLISLMVSLLANVIFALILYYVIQRLRFWWHLRRRFHNKVFSTHRKRCPDEEIQIVNCKVTGNRIRFTGNGRVKDNPFVGEFTMNQINIRMGEGFYTHEEGDGFAFAKIAIKDKNTFVVATLPIKELCQFLPFM